MDKKQALTKCMTLCSRQEYCPFDIREKLKRWGLTEADSTEIIAELIRQKFIDELRFAEAFVKDKLRFNHWGRVKIRYMLSLKKIQRANIDQAIAGIDENLYMEILNHLLQKKQQQLKSEPDEWIRKQKVIRHLQSHGFELEEIMKNDE